MQLPLVGLFYRKHTPSYTMNNSCEVAFSFIGNNELCLKSHIKNKMNLAEF